MRKNQSIVLLLLISLFLSSCAQVTKGSGKRSSGSDSTDRQVHLTPEQIQKLNQETMAKVSDKLKELSIAAKASGPDKVRFLSSDMYLKASAAHMEGDYQTANLIFKHLVGLVPEDNFVQKKYAVSLIRTGDLKKSEKILARVFKSSKQRDSKVGLILAGVYSSLGQSDNSKKIYKQLLSVNPKNEDACVFLGKAYALENKFKTAVKTLKACERRIKQRGVFSYYIGKMYVDKNKLNKAKYYFKRATKIEPDFSQAVMAQGLIYEEQKKNKQAIKVYKKYLKKYPNDTLILTRMVQLLFVTEKYEDVIPYAEVLSDYEPDNLNLKVKLGILYTDNKNYHKAISTFNDLLVYAPENDKILYYLAAIYQEMEEFENAITYFTKISPDSGLYQDSSIQVAQMLSTVAQKEFYEGRKDVSFSKRFVTFVDNKMKEIKKLEVEFSVIKAGYFENIEDNTNAIFALEKVVKKESFTENHKYYLASLYEKEGVFDKSTDLIMEILANDSNNAHAWNFLGYSLVERGVDLDKALEFLTKAYEISPKDGYIRDSLGWYYYKKGNTERALKELHFAISKVPNDISIQKHLATVYSKLKNFSKAKEYIFKALKNVKLASERKELTEVLKDLEVERMPASFK